MTSTRRSFMKSAAMFVGAVMCPDALRVQRPARNPIDLKPWCGDIDAVSRPIRRKYEIKTPFIQGDHAYATDIHAVIRTQSHDLSDEDQEDKLRPEANGLAWSNAMDGVGWRSGDDLLRVRTDPWHQLCPICRRMPWIDCAECYGTGSGIPDEFGEFHESCKSCNGNGQFKRCGACNDTGYVDYGYDFGSGIIAPYHVHCARSLGEFEWRDVSGFVRNSEGNEIPVVAVRGDGWEVLAASSVKE